MFKMNLRFFGEGDDHSPEVPENESAKLEPITITQEALNAIDAKAKTKGEQAILKQLNLASKDDLPKLLEKLQAIQTAEAQAEQDKPELERLSGENKTLASDLELERQARAKEKAELEELKQEKILKNLKVPDNMLEFYAFKINKLVTDELSFEEAAKKYIKDNPIAPPPPQLRATGTGRNQTVKNPVDMNKLLFSKLPHK